MLCGISSSSMRHETPRPSSRWPKQGEWWDGGRRLPVVGGLFVRIGILNELGLIPGAREYVETVGRPLIYPFGTESAGHCSMLATKVRLLPRCGAAWGAGCGSSVSWVLRSPLMAGSCAQVGKISASTWAASIAAA